MKERIKLFIKSERTFFAVLIILVGVCGYMLGQESVREIGGYNTSMQAAIIFTQPVAVENEDVVQVPVVSSRSGTRYHRPDCPGAATIKASNLIYFDSVDLARSAGYLPAQNCPGLE